MVENVIKWKFKHYKQQYNWDCGITCIIIILPDLELKQKLLTNFRQICLNEGFHKSTWTIDLCYLLKHFHIRHHYYTMTIGVHPEYKTHHYYMEILTKDEKRVNDRFDKAANHGIDVTLQRLTIEELVRHLTFGPIISLTDAGLLECKHCKLNCLNNDIDQSMIIMNEFKGHYIVICGYDSKTSSVFYQNPASNCDICVMDLKVYDKARKAYGTDEDTILIYT